MLSGSSQNLIVLGSSDKVAKVYASNGINYELINTMDFYSNYIYAVCHREGGGYAIASGSSIYLHDMGVNIWSLF